MKRPNKNNYCNDDGYFTDKSHYIGAMDDYCNYVESQLKEKESEIVKLKKKLDQKKVAIKNLIINLVEELI